MARLKVIGYKYQDGHRHKCKVDAEVVYNELESIRTDDGILPDDVVRRAEDTNNPLHGFFTWDDNEAARLRRLDEARYLIRSVRIVYESPSNQQQAETSVRVYQNLQAGQYAEPYKPIEDIVNDPTMRDRLIRKAKRELIKWRNNYDGILEFADIYRAIDAIDDFNDVHASVNTGAVSATL